MGYQVATAAIGPLLYLQGRAVRRAIPVLPEPDGARTGQTGEGSPLRLLILGDSAAAGVGAHSMQESLTGQLVNQLSASYSMHWRLDARTGATTESTLQLLSERATEKFDVCLTSLGVNDVTSGIGVNRWLAQQLQLRQLLRKIFSVNHLIICGLPPMHSFPALPQPLRWWLGARATDFDMRLQQALSKESDASFLSLRFSLDRSLMARDGFHPGPKGHREWASIAASMIKKIAA